MITSKEAALFLGISQSQFKHLSRKDRAPLIKPLLRQRGRGKCNLFLMSDLRRAKKYLELRTKLKLILEKK